MTQNTIQTVIVDDEEASRNLLRTMLNQHCRTIEVVGEAATALQGLDVIREQKPQLVFLDIEMPGGDGFSLLDEFNSLDFHVIFATAYNEYAIKAIKYAALDFILKPIRKEDLVRAVERSEQRIYHEQQFQVLNEFYTNNVERERIILPGNNSQLVVHLRDICKIKARNNYVIFSMNDGSQFLASHNLQYYAELLPEKSFYRIHRSCIVNLNHVRGYDKGSGGEVYLSNGTREAIATRRKSDFISSLRKL